MRIMQRAGSLQNRRRWGVVAALALGGVCAWLIWPSRILTLKDYDGIRPGMTRDQVEGLLGRPGATSLDDDWVESEPRDRPGIAYSYLFDGCGVFVVRFDAEGRVTEKEILNIMICRKDSGRIRFQDGVDWAVRQIHRLTR